jgi:hypothetical protein
VTGRGLAVQGGLALAGLAIAYGTWQREPERAAGEVIVVDASKSELGSVHFEDDNTASMFSAATTAAKPAPG